MKLQDAQTLTSQLMDTVEELTTKNKILQQKMTERMDDQNTRMESDQKTQEIEAEQETLKQSQNELLQELKVILKNEEVSLKTLPREIWNMMQRLEA